MEPPLDFHGSISRSSREPSFSLAGTTVRVPEGPVARRVQSTPPLDVAEQQLELYFFPSADPLARGIGLDDWSGRFRASCDVWMARCAQNARWTSVSI